MLREFARLFLGFGGGRILRPDFENGLMGARVPGWERTGTSAERFVCGAHGGKKASIGRPFVWDEFDL